MRETSGRPKDGVFLARAVAAKANTAVTSDRDKRNKGYYSGIPIITPPDLEEIDAGGLNFACAINGEGKNTHKPRFNARSLLLLLLLLSAKMESCLI